MPINHVAVVSIPVSDVDRAKRFYVEQLGFELRYDGAFGEGQRWVEVAPKGGQTRLTLVNHLPSMPAGSLQGLVLDTDDTAAAVADLKSRGVTFWQDVTDDAWGIWAGFDDPDGNGWVLAKAKPSAEAH